MNLGEKVAKWPGFYSKTTKMEDMFVAESTDNELCINMYQLIPLGWGRGLGGGAASTSQYQPAKDGVLSNVSSCFIIITLTKTYKFSVVYCEKTPTEGSRVSGSIF